MDRTQRSCFVTVYSRYNRLLAGRPAYLLRQISHAPEKQRDRHDNTGRSTGISRSFICFSHSPSGNNQRFLGRQRTGLSFVDILFFLFAFNSTLYEKIWFHYCDEMDEPLFPALYTAFQDPAVGTCSFIFGYHPAPCLAGSVIFSFLPPSWLILWMFMPCIMSLLL